MRLATLLIRSSTLHQTLDEALGDIECSSGDHRATVTLDALLVSRQHADAVRLLLSQDLGSTAIGVLRMQFEAVVRATWALFAASPQAIAALAAPLTPATSKAASSLGLPNELLKAIDKSEAPQDLKRSLLEFRATSWEVTNSYVHAGIHPLRRHMAHHEHELAMTLRFSNGLAVICYALMTIVGQVPQRQADINVACVNFLECLPPRRLP